MTDNITIKIDLSLGLLEYSGDPNHLENVLKVTTGVMSEVRAILPTPSTSKTTKSKSAKTTTKSVSSKKAVVETDKDLEPNQIANNVKTHSEYKKIQSKIILKPSEAYNKCKFILYMTGKPMGSGQIHRALEALGIKITPSGISKALSGKKMELMTQGVSPEKYSLSASLKATFEEWLLSNDTEN